MPRASGSSLHPAEPSWRSSGCSGRERRHISYPRRVAKHLTDNKTTVNGLHETRPGDTLSNNNKTLQPYYYTFDWSILCVWDSTISLS